MPNADAGSLDVVKLDDELVISSGERRRALRLPRKVAALDLAGARLETDRLVVRFAPGLGAEGHASS